MLAPSHALALCVRYAAAEAFFVDAMVACFDELGLERFTLVRKCASLTRALVARRAQPRERRAQAGHSMGAMMATAYALRVPGRVEHLVLISPAVRVAFAEFE